MTAIGLYAIAMPRGDQPEIFTEFVCDSGRKWSQGKCEPEWSDRNGVLGLAFLCV